MKRKTVIIISIVNLVIMVLVGIIPPIIYSSTGVFDNLSTYMNITYWICFALTLVFFIGFIFFCINHQKMVAPKLFITTEVFVLLMQVLPNITILFNQIEDERNYIYAAILDLAIIVIWIIIYAFLNTRQIRSRYQ
ncbi:MAG: hypothetical protein LUB56_01020 [Coprobacillus sp.]|nr:hypothetical protein [Coprobacillus sp.]